ncbi:hypothetical protein ND861_08945 [Leptospira sp. 2 VSF19]|uniref:Molecular chaperone DnaJ n=1 Tax=Leptospira soteropolitanensis TaxID=2950025 RepID=A0AAW5VGV1_9LEPT|nr:hypothetical protein [Leptospira soteropolitanensis]MCW7492671.1 hypothetical protein [Leptospira soteropolitanensis]MCW7500354.1 hypothetical protein [Leptospira soteropolitanensis]MCW7522611.1 hypothetical protein [Leptospira soteropolitanensis]MCW7526467.1 hypothetical protein [Leptospira soteropolitanensis]MCW7530324.1 hypothetical protein [Leptospira soteropolitanensis]
MPKQKSKLNLETEETLVWTGVSSNQTKAQKEFNDAFRKHKETLERSKEIEPLFQLVNETYLQEVLPELEKQKKLERERFALMCSILLEEKLSFGKMQREFLRRYLLDICNDSMMEDTGFYGIYRDQLETKFEKMERIRYKNQMESRIKNTFGIDIDLDDMNRTTFDSEEERESHEEKYREFREKYEEYRSEYFNRSRTHSGERKKTKAQTEREKKQLEAERLLSTDINTLFKNLAKLIHPDKEQDPILRERKSKLMTKLSSARDNMNIAEILEIKLQVDELLPNQQTDVSFHDTSIKRFIGIIKTKIRELEDSIRQRFFSHPLMADFSEKKISKESLGKYLKRVKLDNQMVTKAYEKEVQQLKMEPKYIKEMIKELQSLGVQF